MLRIPFQERPYWRRTAIEYGFRFHTMYGEPYWDESIYYRFTLEQIEQDIEQPTEELHQMCLEVVDMVLADEQWLRRFQVPEPFWQQIADSWQRRDPSLYSRLDLAYHGQGAAKLLENNADTPTSLYETGFWQWLWLEEGIAEGRLNEQADQFNSLQEKLIARIAEIAQHHGLKHMHFSCCDGSEEDRGTVQYLQDCAAEAGIDNSFVYIEEIGLNEAGYFTDTDERIIEQMFKLYPWEFMQRDAFADAISGAGVKWLEPLWKTLLSNKALLPMLWKRFPDHPNLLPAYFADELSQANEPMLIKKPIYSREGANISLLDKGREILGTDGPYGDEGFIYQAYCPLPKFDEQHTLIGSWLVNDQAAGLSVREDKSPITQDLSRFIPHVIL